MARRRHTAKHPAQTDFDALLKADTTDGPRMVRETAAASPATSPAPAYFADYVPIYTVKLVRIGSLALREQPMITGPRSVVSLLFKHFDGADREWFVALLLDVKTRIIGITTISVGDLSSAPVHPREVFKPAILSNAASVVLAHNHPSGDPVPSVDDVAITSRLTEAGETLGIPVLDHIVVGDADRWVSMNERGLLTFGPAGASKIGDGAAKSQTYLSPLP